MAIPAAPTIEFRDDPGHLAVYARPLPVEAHGEAGLIPVASLPGVVIDLAHLLA
ncbi:MAG: hypothetical protein KC442_07750 [Thermomicrobiales bacterium]|nr:hypothetical protein [Thermomicrobiales bacterium]MCA9877658.1 hypothetical protein [Thermomicrobiales bacterium]